MSGNFGAKRVALSGDWYEAVDPNSIPFHKVCSLCLKYAVKKRKQCTRRSERNALRKREAR